MLGSRSAAKVTVSRPPELSNTADATMGAAARPSRLVSPSDDTYTACCVSGFCKIMSAARTLPALRATVSPARIDHPRGGTTISSRLVDHAHIALALLLSPNTRYNVSDAMTAGLEAPPASEQRNPPERMPLASARDAACPCRSDGKPTDTPPRPPILVSRSNVSTAASATSRSLAFNNRGASTMIVSTGRWAGLTNS